MHPRHKHLPRRRLLQFVRRSLQTRGAPHMQFRGCTSRPVLIFQFLYPQWSMCMLPCCHHCGLPGVKAKSPRGTRRQEPDSSAGILLARPSVLFLAALRIAGLPSKSNCSLPRAPVAVSLGIQRRGKGSVGINLCPQVRSDRPIKGDCLLQF